MSKPRTLVALVPILLLALIAGASPDTVGAGLALNVTKTGDTADGACDADCSLREAIIAANAAPGSAVNVPAGTYTLTIPGDHEDAAAQDDLDLNVDVTIVGAGSATTIIDGGAFTRIFDIVPTDTAVEISRLTLQNGFSPGGGAIDNHAELALTDVVMRDNEAPVGGAISNQGDLTMTDVVIDSNTATDAGGGISNEVTGSMTIISSTISGNVASSQGDGIASSGMVTITNSSVNGNSTMGGAGGVYSRGMLVMTASTASDNDAAFEGAIAVDGGSGMLTDVTVSGNSGGGVFHIGDGSITIARTRIVDNEAPGLEVDGAGPVSVVDSEISRNTGDGLGGGIFHDADSVMTIERTTFAGNSARRGGGILILGSGPTTIIDSTISGNHASEDGGGITRTFDGSMAIINSTVADNSTNGAGGGLFDDDGRSPFTVENSIVANNTADGDPDNCATIDDGEIQSEGHNISSDNNCHFNASGDMKNTDPLIGPLAANGGLTQTHALLAASPAIDAGANPVCPKLDQRAGMRPVDGDGDTQADCDIGAFEFGALVPTPTPSATPALKLTQGDVDCDEDVDSVDALKQLRHVAALSVSQTEPCPDIASEVASLFGDVDCDEDVDSVDALKVLRHVAALTVSQTKPCSDIGTSLS